MKSTAISEKTANHASGYEDQTKNGSDYKPTSFFILHGHFSFKPLVTGMVTIAATPAMKINVIEAENCTMQPLNEPIGRHPQKTT